MLNFTISILPRRLTILLTEDISMEDPSDLMPLLKETDLREAADLVVDEVDSVVARVALVKEIQETQLLF